MTAIDELRASINLEDLIKQIALKLDFDMNQINKRGNINHLKSHTFDLIGNNKSIVLMSGTGLIGSERNHFGMGVYWYTPQAKELYERLKKEGFYDKK